MCVSWLELGSGSRVRNYCIKSGVRVYGVDVGESSDGDAKMESRSAGTSDGAKCGG